MAVRARACSSCGQLVARLLALQRGPRRYVAVQALCRTGPSRYRRIGVHRYRRQGLYRNVQRRWRRIKDKWVLYLRNHYYRRPRWFWGRS